MIDYEKLSDDLLAQRICSYEREISLLLEEINAYLSSPEGRDESPLRAAYADLKERIRTEAHDLNTGHNKRCRDTDIFMNYYYAVVEADTYGFACPAKSSVSKKMAEALDEARNRLTKSFSINEWTAHCKIR